MWIADELKSKMIKWTLRRHRQNLLKIDIRLTIENAPKNKCVKIKEKNEQIS